MPQFVFVAQICWERTAIFKATRLGSVTMAASRLSPSWRRKHPVSDRRCLIRLMWAVSCDCVCQIIVCSTATHNVPCQAEDFVWFDFDLRHHNSVNSFLLELICPPWECWFWGTESNCFLLIWYDSLCKSFLLNLQHPVSFIWWLLYGTQFVGMIIAKLVSGLGRLKSGSDETF